MRTLQDIQSILVGQKQRLFAEYPIRSMAIFGSFARSEQTKSSDLDLMVDVNNTIGIRFIDLADEIESYLGIKVDLVSRSGIKDRYFQTIHSELIYV